MSDFEDRVNGSRPAGANGSPADSILTPDVRQIGTKDEAGLLCLLLNLDKADRCRRFGQAVNDGFVARYVEHVFIDASWVVGAFVDAHLCGVVEIYDAAPHGYVEAAFVVEAQWRRRGLGWTLLQTAMHLAAEGNADTLRMIFCRDNWAMRKLATKSNGRLDIVLDEIAVDVHLGAFGYPRLASSSAPEFV